MTKLVWTVWFALCAGMYFFMVPWALAQRAIHGN
jgi:hypothetical protein